MQYHLDWLYSECQKPPKGFRKSRHKWGSVIWSSLEGKLMIWGCKYLWCASKTSSPKALCLSEYNALEYKLIEFTWQFFFLIYLYHVLFLLQQGCSCVSLPLLVTTDMLTEHRTSRAGSHFGPSAGRFCGTKVLICVKNDWVITQPSSVTDIKLEDRSEHRRNGCQVLGTGSDTQMIFFRQWKITHTCMFQGSWMCSTTESKQNLKCHVRFELAQALNVTQGRWDVNDKEPLTS